MSSQPLLQPAASLLGAALFAAEKHRSQKRKDGETPYINHPIAVAELLARTEVSDIHILLAALLHDTIEDTSATPEEVEQRFGSEVRSMVQEVTDDRSLPKAERKRLQIEHAPRLSPGAKQIKVADKMCNISEFSPTNPPDWTLERKLEYMEWGERVVTGCRGANPKLDELFDSLVQQKKTELQASVFRGVKAGGCGGKSRDPSRADLG